MIALRQKTSTYPNSSLANAGGSLGMCLPESWGSHPRGNDSPAPVMHIFAASKRKLNEIQFSHLNFIQGSHKLRSIVKFSPATTRGTTIHTRHKECTA